MTSACSPYSACMLSRMARLAFHCGKASRQYTTVVKPHVNILFIGIKYLTSVDHAVTPGDTTPITGARQLQTVTPGDTTPITRARQLQTVTPGDTAASVR